MQNHEKLPALRPVDVTQVHGEDGQPYLLLQDMLQIAERPLAVSAAGYLALAHLDGAHSCAEIQAAYLEELGVMMPAEQIIRLVETLDRALLLEGERFEQVYARRRADYHAAPARDSRDRYPDAHVLRAELQRLVAGGTATPTGKLRGLIAPHLDYERGYACYADAYATLAAATPADRYVILGTNHAGRASPLVATRKDFLTQLGLARNDVGFLERLEKRVGKSLCEHEHEHLVEHSIELQVHLLQVVNRERPFTIVPVICTSPIAEHGRCDNHPGDQLRRFADALAESIAESDQRTLVIAAADLSHVGQRFGEQEPTTPEFLAQVAQRDRELLTLLERREEDKFVARLAESDNPTRICSVGCIYTMLRSLPDRPCRVLTYHQAINSETETHVTCTAAIVT